MSKLRRRALAARRALSEKQRAAASAVVCRVVCEAREFRSARRIGCYLPMHDEVDTGEIIERAWCANKRIFVPVLRNGAQMSFREIKPDSVLERNRVGIWEPTHGMCIDARKLDVVITPTVAFDRQCNRIGMGGGYYDRCFAFLRHRRIWIRPKLIGVAFDCQKVEKITANPWDIRLYQVITEREQAVFCREKR